MDGRMNLQNEFYRDWQTSYFESIVTDFGFSLGPTPNDDDDHKDFQT